VAIELDRQTIAHWSKEFERDEQQTLKAALEALGEPGFRLWLMSLGFEGETITGAGEKRAGCPWGPHEGPLAALVKQSFGDSLAGTMSALAERCVAVYRVKNHGQWSQLYVVEDQGRHRIYAGGPPNSAPVVSAEFRGSRWEIPYLLKTFYRSHDGFGALDNANAFWYEDAILPSAALAPLTRYMSPREEIDYDPEDCLLFYPDGGGSGYCFRRSGKQDGQPGLVFWSCRDQELSEAPAFLSLLKGVTSAS
jgi:hypothetical protein